MKQILPFYKEIVFENKIANIVSISLEHSERILDGEVSGEFILCGEYKSHSDTTEVEEFKYKLPFTTLIPDDVDTETVKVDITNFNYEQIDENVLRVDIDFSIEGDEIERTAELLDYVDEDISLNENIDEEINNILNIVEDDSKEDEEVREGILNEADLVKTEDIIEQSIEKVGDVENKVEIKEEIKEEYVTYHVHIVNNMDSIESIMKMYNVNLDLLKEYNDIKELKIGDKVLIPEYLDE